MIKQSKAMLIPFKLVTVHIIYHLPDHPRILQEFIWQEYDLPPQYWRINKFIKYWREHIEGKIKDVIILSGDQITQTR